MNKEMNSFKVGDLIIPVYGTRPLYVVIAVFDVTYDGYCIARVKNIATQATIMVETKYYKKIVPTIENSKDD